MDMFIQHYSTPIILKRLNYCRMYLRVSRLSDITTNDGYTIQPGYYNGTQINPYTTQHWPRQQRPSDKVWKLWQGALNVAVGNNRRLKHPLRSWTKVDCSPTYWYHLTHQTVIQIQCNKCLQSPVHKRRRTIHLVDRWEEVENTGTLIPLVEVGCLQKHPVVTPANTAFSPTWEEKHKQSW